MQTSSFELRHALNVPGWVVVRRGRQAKEQNTAKDTFPMTAECLDAILDGGDVRRLGHLGGQYKIVDAPAASFRNPDETKPAFGLSFSFYHVTEAGSIYHEGNTPDAKEPWTYPSQIQRDGDPLLGELEGSFFLAGRIDRDWDRVVHEGCEANSSGGGPGGVCCWLSMFMTAQQDAATKYQQRGSEYPRCPAARLSPLIGDDVEHFIASEAFPAGKHLKAIGRGRDDAGAKEKDGGASPQKTNGKQSEPESAHGVQSDLSKVVQGMIPLIVGSEMETGDAHWLEYPLLRGVGQMGKQGDTGRGCD